jgi:hypothetical protein
LAERLRQLATPPGEVAEHLGNVARTLDQVAERPFPMAERLHRMAERLGKMARRAGKMTERLRKVAERLLLSAESLREPAKPPELEFERVSFEPERVWQDAATPGPTSGAPSTLLIVKGAISFDGRRLIRGSGCDDVALGQDANRSRRLVGLGLWSAPRPCHGSEHGRHRQDDEGEQSKRYQLSKISRDPMQLWSRTFERRHRPERRARNRTVGRPDKGSRGRRGQTRNAVGAMPGPELRRNSAGEIGATGVRLEEAIGG